MRFRRFVAACTASALLAVTAWVFAFPAQSAGAQQAQPLAAACESGQMETCSAALLCEIPPDTRAQNRRRKAAIAFLRTAFRLLVVLPLSLLGRFVLWLGEKLLVGLAPFWKLFVPEFLFTLLAFGLVMVTLHHLLFPGQKLRAYLRVPTLGWLFAASVCEAALKTALSLMDAANFAAWTTRACFILLCVFWLWHKTLCAKGSFFLRFAHALAQGRGAVLLCLTALSVGGTVIGGASVPAQWYRSILIALLDGACFSFLCAAAGLCICQFCRVHTVHRRSPSRVSHARLFAEGSRPS